ncbi:MAG TPA: hypothetical protein GXZ28_05615 [Clostridiales bacterium]|nr:hypothetical protein [Clostridiales bacterium]
MKKLIILIIIILMFPSSAQASELPTLTADNLTLSSGERYNINIKHKTKGSKYHWWSDNEDIAIVNKSNGYVTAISQGITKVYCQITKGETEIVLSCKVEVDNPKFFEHKYMAHATGGYEGNIYNNTEEALINSIENGYIFIEIDLTLTADNKLVCSHGWDKATCEATGIEYTSKTPTYDEFMSWKIQGKYNTIDVSTIIDYMKEYPDLLIEVDLKKFNAKKTKIMINQLVELADHDDTILDRILMQFTSENAYFAIEEIYQFKYYQYFTYKSRIADELDDVIKFCKDNKVTSIAVNHTVLTNDMINTIKDNGFYLLAFTIDDEEVAQEFLEKGVDTICTNFITK